MNKDDGKPTPLNVVRSKRDRAGTQALLACLREDTKSILDLDDFAGYALVAWGRDGRPSVYPRLFRPENPIPAYVLPAYLQMAANWWIEDGMPQGFKPT